jgi:hypothetical protein
MSVTTSAALVGYTARHGHRLMAARQTGGVSSSYAPNGG